MSLRWAVKKTNDVQKGEQPLSVEVVFTVQKSGQEGKVHCLSTGGVQQRGWREAW